MTDIVGGCLCGRVRYRGSAEPLFTANCHCKHCQKTTGTSFSIVLGLPRDSLVLEGGPLTTYRDTGESGMAVQRKFCGICGSPVLSEVEAAPTLVFLKGGTLDDTSQLQPQMDIWCDHAQPWLPAGEGRTRVARNPDLG